MRLTSFSMNLNASNTDCSQCPSSKSFRTLVGRSGWMFRVSKGGALPCSAVPARRRGRFDDLAPIDRTTRSKRSSDPLTTSGAS